MPQGKVIAVKPYSLVDTSHVEGESTLQSEDFGIANVQRRLRNLVYIENIKNNPQETEEIFWYEDTSLNLAVEDSVNFKINNRRTRLIKGAVDVKREKSISPYLPTGLVSKVALLASLLLLASVVIESKKRR